MGKCDMSKSGKIYDYLTMTDTSPLEFDRTIRQYLEEGWELYGFQSVNTIDGDPDHDFQYTQVLVARTKVTVRPMKFGDDT